MAKIKCISRSGMSITNGMISVPKWVSDIVGSETVDWLSNVSQTDLSSGVVPVFSERCFGLRYLGLESVASCCGARAISPFPFETDPGLRSWERELSRETARRFLPKRMAQFAPTYGDTDRGKSFFCILTPFQREIFGPVLEELGFETIGVPWKNSSTNRILQMYQKVLYAKGGAA